MKLLFPALLVLCLGCKPSNSPTADLASPSQETRDAAAKTLRATAKPPPRIKWFFFTSHIKTGETESNILELLRSSNLSTNIVGGMGGLVDYYEYRLDDYWLLGCVFNNNDYKRKILEDWKLIPRWRDVWVRPPTNFTGIWITYFANGQTNSEANYKDGFRSGKESYFYPDGSISSVWHYDHDKRNGSWKQYFSSGRIQDQVQYSNNVRIGIRVRYNEDGTTNFIKNYSKP